MPFETLNIAPKNIAVIGAGISGMGAAYMLSKSHRVTLFEAEDRLGGHARTVVAGRNGNQPVDTGFIVFNKVNYPHLTDLFETLDVPIANSNMSFGASFGDGRFEYGLASVDAIFAQRRNVVNARFLGMLRDIKTFNARAVEFAKKSDVSIETMLGEMGTSSWFRDRYLMPLTGAIWSTPVQRMLSFPAQALIRFMKNHALMAYSGQHQWYTVQGGSVEYVDRLQYALAQQGVRLRWGTPISSVRRSAGQVEIRPVGGVEETFDEVVFATHSDDTLKLLADPSPSEKKHLGAVTYQPNSAVLHCDTSVMPKRRKVWSSWVYKEDPAKKDQIALSYWMNSLQPIPHDDPMFVTLNATQEIREELIYDTTTFRHPVYTVEAIDAQQAISAMNGTNRTWFCGAWMKNGFHEDGLSSAVDVADAMARLSDLKMAAE